MKILIVTQYFYPETFKSTDLAFKLSERGHKVTVLTGIPNYPEGKIYPGYGYFKKRKEIINNIPVYRSFLIPRGRGSGIRLFINYYSWAFFASLDAFRLSLKMKFDAVIVHEPSPITQFYPAQVVSWLQKIPIYFWVMDLWPDSLKYVGGIKNKLILGYYSRVVKKFYKKSEKILITSRGFKSSILEKGDFENKIEYFPNWAEDTISGGDINYDIPKLPEGFKILFAGNVGEAQDMDTIMNAAKLLKDHSEIKFIIVGDGRKMTFVKDFVIANHLTETVRLIGRFPIEAMSAFFNKADMLLVSLNDDPIFNLTVPAKVQAYMSAGKPILAMLNGEGAQLINEAQCGFAIPASDEKNLAEVVLEASRMDKEALNELGTKGKLYYKKHFTISTCMDNLERILNKK